MRFGTGAASGRCTGKNVADVVFKLAAVGVAGSFRLEVSGEKGEVKLIRL